LFIVASFIFLVYEEILPYILFVVIMLSFTAEGLLAITITSTQGNSIRNIKTPQLPPTIAATGNQIYCQERSKESYSQLL
jgi:cbb3-type cytochrome oxidase cytochrome c subunit